MFSPRLAPNSRNCQQGGTTQGNSLAATQVQSFCETQYGPATADRMPWATLLEVGPALFHRLASVWTVQVRLGPPIWARSRGPDALGHPVGSRACNSPPTGQCVDYCGARPNGRGGWGLPAPRRSRLSRHRVCRPWMGRMPALDGARRGIAPRAARTRLARAMRGVVRSGYRVA